MRINGARATNQHSATMKKLAIGIDIGGINTAFGLVDENGDLYADSVVSTKKFQRFTELALITLCRCLRAV